MNKSSLLYALRSSADFKAQTVATAAGGEKEKGGQNISKQDARNLKKK